VVPKTSLLRVDENKFLSFREIQKQIKKKETECYKKSMKVLTSSSCQSLTPFQYNEILKHIQKDKIKSNKEKVLLKEESEQNVASSEVLIHPFNSKFSSLNLVEMGI